MRKPGVFDPWRQDEPVAPQEEKAYDPDAEVSVEEDCVRFQGERTWVHVWLPGGTGTPQGARKILHEILSEVKEDPFLHKKLTDQGVLVDEKDFVVSADTAEKAIDVLSMALRATVGAAKLKERKVSLVMKF